MLWCMSDMQENSDDVVHPGEMIEYLGQGVRQSALITMTLGTQYPANARESQGLFLSWQNVHERQDRYMNQGRVGV